MPLNLRILPLLRSALPGCVLALVSSVAQAQLAIEITGAGANRMPVAVATFEGESALPRSVTDVVRADLERSGLFKMVELGPGPMGADAPVDFARVRSRGADAVAVGTVSPSGGRYQVQVRLHDTATGTAVPNAEGPVARMYVCGITPYDATHMGHAATYVTFDLVQRVWLDAGHAVDYVQNVTDVDDPLLARALETGFGVKISQAAFVAGHSLGEYTALVAAGSLTLVQALPLVRFRAAAMQEAVPVGVGAMAAILGLASDKVIEGCKEAQASFAAGSAEVVEAVNFNDAAQTVIAGSKAAVDKACEVLKGMGAKRALLLPVSAPFHSSLMKPAAEKLREKLATLTLGAPQIPVLNNIDVAIETDADRIRDALYRQAFGPVRWVECVQAIKEIGRAHV